MRLVRLAIANVNATVGAVTSNVDRALVVAKRAAEEEGASLVVLPEQVIGGYMQEDLVQWRRFVEAQEAALLRFAGETSAYGIPFALGVTVRHGDHLYNCAALVHRGAVLGLVPKEKLPSYNIFYEGRTLACGRPGFASTLREGALQGTPFGDLVFAFDFGTVALEVCEDLWSPDGPMRRRCYAGAEIVCNLSASPFRLGVVDTRREMIATRSGDNQTTVVYAALVGANDGLIYDGGGFVAQNGRMLLEGRRFTEGVSAVTVDLDRTRRLRAENTTWRLDQEAYEAGACAQPTRITAGSSVRGREALRFPPPPGKSFFLPGGERPPHPRETFAEDLLDALALGVGDYFEKTRAFKTIGVALSGGRDSLLCLLIAARYVAKRYGEEGPERVREKTKELLRAFYMPSRFSSNETRNAAEIAAKELGVPFAIVPIDDAFEREAIAMKGMLQEGETLPPIAMQNIQARVRSARMWTWTNAAGGLFLQTSNMSEKAAGYTTIGGDMEGALAVIANVPKTVVNMLLDHLYAKTQSEGIRLTLEKPASAELAPGQEDERDLMPFPVLDASFALYAGEKMSVPEVHAALVSIFPEYPPETLAAWANKFGRLFTQSIYKWVQAPLSLHVGNLDLDRERALQLPVVQHTEW